MMTDDAGASAVIVLPSGRQQKRSATFFWFEVPPFPGCLLRHYNAAVLITGPLMPEKLNYHTERSQRIIVRRILLTVGLIFFGTVSFWVAWRHIDQWLDLQLMKAEQQREDREFRLRQSQLPSSTTRP